MRDLRFGPASSRWPIREMPIISAAMATESAGNRIDNVPPIRGRVPTSGNEISAHERAPIGKATSSRLI